MEAPFTKRELTRKVRKNVQVAKSSASKRSRPPYVLVRQVGHQVHRTHRYNHWSYCWFCLMCPDMTCCAGAVLPCSDSEDAPACPKKNDTWRRIANDNWRRGRWR